MIINNVILGTDEGKFRVTFIHNKKDKRAGKTIKVPADKPEKVIIFLKGCVKKYGKITNLMGSSTLDFPKEEGVTAKQVEKLMRLFAK